MQGDLKKLNKELGKKGSHIMDNAGHILPREEALSGFYVSAGDTLERLSVELCDGVSDLAEYEKWLKEDNS